LELPGGSEPLLGSLGIVDARRGTPPLGRNAAYNHLRHPSASVGGAWERVMPSSSTVAAPEGVPSTRCDALEQHPYHTGGIFALLSLPSHSLLPVEQSQQVAAVVMGVIAGVYLGYAFQDGRRGVILLESAVAIAFSTLALLGLWH